jgi:hypothetical protein
MGSMLSCFNVASKHFHNPSEVNQQTKMEMELSAPGVSSSEHSRLFFHGFLHFSQAKSQEVQLVETHLLFGQSRSVKGKPT